MAFRERIKPVFMSTGPGRALWERARTMKGRAPDLIWPAEARWLYGTRRQELDSAPAPVLIGGTGGSGTRAVARILEAAGLFMGAHLNHAHDALPTIRRYTAKWARYAEDQGASLPPREQRRMDFDLVTALLKHRGGLHDIAKRWGAKNPRFIFFLPHLDHCFPRMRFIHLVRDGRDMAFSENKFQLREVGALYSEALRTRLAGESDAVRAMALWAAINRDARRYGDTHLQDRYVCIRFEDLCARPRSVLQELLDFAGCGPEHLERAMAEVLPPPTLGRWRQQDPALMARVLEEGRQALEIFGYTED